MSEAPENRAMGEQPIAAIMAELGLKVHDLVAASPSQITHKLVARACKGRWLTPHSQRLMRDALNAAAKASYAREDLFNYASVE